MRNRISKFFLFSIAVFGLAMSGALFQEQSGNTPKRKAVAMVGNASTLAKAYGRWKSNVVEAGSEQRLTLPLRQPQGHASAKVRARGLAKIDLGSGRLDIEIQGLDDPASHAVWLVDRAEGDDSKPNTVRLGLLNKKNERAIFQGFIDYDALGEFQLDKIVVTVARQNPEDGPLLSGSPNLFQRLFYQELRGGGVALGKGNTQLSTSATRKILPLLSLVPAPAYAQAAGGDAELELLIAAGEDLFFNEKFGGNGRTCGTCHALDNNFTIDPKFIATLKPRDRLFIAEYNRRLRDLENPTLMRDFGLILANVDGLEDPTEKFVMRSVPHMLGMSLSIQSNATEAPLEMTGWAGDGAPGSGRLRDFPVGAVIQHFTKNMKRREGRHFRLPTEAELDAMEAFMLSLGRQEELDLATLRLTDPAAEEGRVHFITEDSENRTKPSAKCNICHRNAGALTVAGLNVNFNTGTENMPHPADLTDEPRPRDDGFGVEPNESTGGFGDGSFNTPSLVEAADTAPYFHHNAAETLEDAIAFYDSNEFRNSIEGQRLVLQDSGGQELTIEIDSLAAFLRVINVLENIRSSVEAMSKAQLADSTDGSERVLILAFADLEDSLEVLEEGELHEEAVLLLENALLLVDDAAAATDLDQRDSLLNDAIADALAAGDLMVADAGPAQDNTAPAVAIQTPVDGASVSGIVSITADASDDVAIDHLTFAIDQVAIGQDAAAPFTQNWDTSSFADGARMVSVTAVDTSGNSTTDSVVVTVGNAPLPPSDTTPPTVTVLSPSAGETLSGTVTVSADAVDDSAVDLVVFKIGQTEIGQVSLPPYEQAWDTTAFSDSGHNVTVVAFDSSGNSGMASVSVTVDNNSSQTCTVYSCPNPPGPPSDPPPDPVTPDGSSPDGEFEGPVLSVDLDGSTVTVSSEDGSVTVKITNETEFNGSIATALHQILPGHILQGEFFSSTGEAVWVEADMPPGL